MDRALGRAAGRAESQGGAVLLVSLLVLLLLAVIGTALGRSSLLQLQMAGNDEANTAAFQQALALVDAVLAEEAGMPVRGGLGYRVCLLGSRDPACDETSLSVDGPPAEAGESSAHVTRVGPLQARLPIMNEQWASSSVAYRGAKFEVSASFTGSARSPGRASLAQGVLVRFEASVN